MHRRKIVSYLSVESLEEGIQKVKDYRLFVRRKAEELRQELASEIALEMDKNFRSSKMEHLVGREMRVPNVSIEIREDHTGTIVVADGEDAVWVEFGAGVHYNGHLHDSPHPLGKELGFTIGDYGKGRGQNDFWGFYDGNGELDFSFGTPASLPMYRAVRSVLERKGNIARRVFGD